MISSRSHEPGIVAHGLFQDFAGHFVVFDSRGIEPEIGGGFVDGAARFEEGVEGLAGVLRLEEGTAAAADRALEKHIRLGVQPDDDAGFF